MQRIAAACSQIPVNLYQILHRADFARQNNFVFRQAQIHGFLRRFQRRHNQRFFHHFIRAFGIGRGQIGIHHALGQALIKAAPVHADAHSFAVFGGGAYHIGKFFIAFCALADIARIDAVFRQSLRTIGKLGQQALAVEMKITNQRRVATHVVQPLADFGHFGRRFRAVDSDAHHFRAGIAQFFHLLRGAGRIGGVGVGHRLHHHRRFCAHLHMVNLHQMGVASCDCLCAHYWPTLNDAVFLPLRIFCATATSWPP